MLSSFSIAISRKKVEKSLNIVSLIAQFKVSKPSSLGKISQITIGQVVLLGLAQSSSLRQSEKNGKLCFWPSQKCDVRVFMLNRLM